MKKFIFKTCIWMIWKNFKIGLRAVLGHKTLSGSIYEMVNIEMLIREQNRLTKKENITWENTKFSTRENVAKYMTLKYFNEIGELLAFFDAVNKKKIMEAYNK